MHTAIKIVALIAVLAGIWVCLFVLNDRDEVALEPDAPSRYMDIAYMIESESVQLVNGIAETKAAPNSAATVVTRYFGNEILTDLDGDGDTDVAFILTQERSGSGTFYYAVAALHTDAGYQGSDAYLLGDRVAPQSTNISPNPRHKNVIVFNYADRAPTEPMSAQPSIGRSAYLKLDPKTTRWAVVEPDFEGEAR